MRNKSDIRAELYNRLNTPAWQSLRNSLVGRELVAYGTELLYMQDAMNSAIVNSFDFSLADERALISLSHAFDLGLCFSAPAWVRVRIPSGTSNTIYPPYSIRCTIGNLVFTNIRHYSADSVITLYQGELHSMLYQPGYGNISFINSDYYEQEPWNITDMTIGTNVIHSHNLGVALPDSVLVFVGSINQSQQVGATRLVNKYNYLRYGPDVLAYKEYTLLDGSLAVLEGDGVWGQVYDGYDLLQIVWLEPTNEQFDAEGLRFIGNGHPQDVVVLSSSQGESGVEFARSQFKKALYGILPVVSKKQVQDYVNSFNYVIDSEVTSDASQVNVYIKPYSLSDDISYADIETELDLRGQLGADFNVVMGNPAVIQFLVAGASLSDPQKSSIVALLNRTFEYHLMKFDWTPDAASIAALIQSNLEISTRVTFRVNINMDSIDRVDSNFLPLQGTVKLYSGGGLVGSDFNKVLFAANTLLNLSLPVGFFGSGFASFETSPSSGLNILSYTGSVLFKLTGQATLLPFESTDAFGSSESLGFVLSKNSGDHPYVLVVDNSDISDLSVYSETPVKGYKFVGVETFTGTFYAVVGFGNYLVVLGEDATAGTTGVFFYDRSVLGAKSDIQGALTDYQSATATWSTELSGTLGMFEPGALMDALERVTAFVDGSDIMLFFNKKCNIINNAASLSMNMRSYEIVFDSDEIQSRIDGGDVVSYGNSEGNLAAVIYAPGTARVVKIGSVLKRNDGTVLLTNLQIYKITGIVDLQYVRTNGVWALIKTLSNVIVVDISTGSTNIPGIYSTGVAGSVNYDTGEIKITDNQNYSVQFDSYNAERPAGTFYMLNETTPCIWN